MKAVRAVRKWMSERLDEPNEQPTEGIRGRNPRWIVAGAAIVAAIIVTSAIVILAVEPPPEAQYHGDPIYTFSADEIWNGFGAVCTASEAQVKWEDITVTLSDGTSNASWSDIEDADFSGFPYEIADCDETSLGLWNVTLLAWDMQPNQVLDVGDYLSFLFRVPLPRDIEFSVVIIHEQSGEVLAEFSHIELS